MIIENISQRPDSERIINFIEEYLVYPDGCNKGQPYKLMDWQKHFIQHAFDFGYTKALLSIPRRNGKTMLIAAIAMAVVILGIENNVTCSAITKSQADMLFTFAAGMVSDHMRFNTHLHLKINPAKKLITFKGDSIRFASMDAAHVANSNDFVIFDELGMLQELPFNYTHKLIAISTKGSKPNNAFAQLCEQAKKDPNIMLIEYSCPQDMNPFGLSAWKIANPMYEYQNRERVMEIIISARDDEKKEKEYRNFHLNQGVN